VYHITLGKSVSLSYFLVVRLKEKKPTVYCDNATYAHVFTHTGVEKVWLKDIHIAPRIDVLDKSINSCGLVDLNPELTEVPSQFRLGPSVQRLGRVVVATSPNPNHVGAFKFSAETYYMPTWGWSDLYCAR
jgi:hypothetical protein